MTPPWARRRGEPGDGSAAITAYLVTLMLIPSSMIIKPLGAVGTPAAVLSILGMLWWSVGRMLPGVPIQRGLQPVRLAMAGLAAALIISYLKASLYPLPPIQRSAADRGLLTLVGWCGVIVVTADMVISKRSIDRLLRRMVGLGTIMATVGILQGRAHIDLTRYLILPGLQENHEYSAFYHTTHDVNRISGTSIHPIEYGMVLVILLPFAIHLATQERRHRVRWWSFVAIMALGSLMSLSRSGVLALAAVFVTMFVGWSGSRRALSLVLVPVALVFTRLLAPGLVGTLMAAFTNTDRDPSLESRAKAREKAGDFIANSPFFGRGFNTFVPSEFFFLDNQYLGLLIEAGAVGVAALAVLLITGMGVARGIRIRSRDQAGRDLGQSFLAAFIAAALGFGSFDGFGFPMYMGVLLVLLGLAGARWRMAYDETRPAPAVAPGRAARRRRLDPPVILGAS